MFENKSGRIEFYLAAAVDFITIDKSQFGNGWFYANFIEFE